MPARSSTPAAQLWEGLSALGLKPFVEKPEDRLVTVNTIKVRQGAEEKGSAGASWGHPGGLNSSAAAAAATAASSLLLRSSGSM